MRFISLESKNSDLQDGVMSGHAPAPTHASAFHPHSLIPLIPPFSFTSVSFITAPLTDASYVQPIIFPLFIDGLHCNGMY